MSEIEYIKYKINKEQTGILWNEDFLKQCERKTIKWLYDNQYEDEYVDTIPEIQYDDKENEYSFHYSCGLSICSIKNQN